MKAALGLDFGTVSVRVRASLFEPDPSLNFLEFSLLGNRLWRTMMRYQSLRSNLDARWLAWWRSESGKPGYTPESTQTSEHYKPQGDQGSGKLYTPSAMPEPLSHPAKQP